MPAKARRSPSNPPIPPSPHASTPADADAPPPEPIPRPPNAWILYRSDKVRELEAQAGPSQPKRPQAVISKEIAKMWKEEAPEVRAMYEKMAEIRKAEHALKYPNYKFNPRKKEDKLRDKEAAKARKAKEREEAGGCKRTKARRVTASPKSEPSPKTSSSTPRLDASLLPPHFTMGPPEGVSPSDIFGFDTTIPPSTFSPSSAAAPVPQLQSPAPVASSSQVPVFDLTTSCDNLDWSHMPQASWLAQDGTADAFSVPMLDFTFPNPPLSYDPGMPVPSGWQPGEGSLSSEAHPATSSIMAQAIGGGPDFLLISGLNQAILDANPGAEIELTAGDGFNDGFFDGFAGFNFPNELLNALDQSGQNLGSDSPVSQPTPALSQPTPAATQDFHAAWNSHEHDVSSTGPLTPPAFPTPHHTDTSTYVPPSGAAYARSRRVGGSWAPAINAR